MTATATLTRTPGLQISEPARLAGAFTTDGKDFVARCHDVTSTPRHAMPADTRDWSGPVSLHQVLTHLESRHGLPVQAFAGGPSLTSYDAGRPGDVDTVRAWYSWLAQHADEARRTHRGTLAAAQLDAFDEATAVARAQGWHTMRGFVSSSAAGVDLPHEIAVRLAKAPVQLGLGTYDDSERGALRVARHRFVTVVAAEGTRHSGEAVLTLADPTVSDRSESVRIRQVMVTVKHGTSYRELAAWRIIGSESYARPTLLHGFSWFDAAKPGF